MSLKFQKTKCKITGEKIPIMFNFGKMPIANDFSSTVSKKNFYEMKVAFNKNLSETVNKIYLERKQTYNESDFKINCNFLKPEKIAEKVLELYEISRNKI